MIIDMRSYLSQGELWIAAGSKSDTSALVLKISEMNHDHRRKAARWLMNRAQALITIVECQTNEGILAADVSDDLSDVLSLIAQEPRAWLRNTPLFTALMSGLPPLPTSYFGTG